ncbi:MAG: TetR/AcrR family transcriptional regulator [Acidimicrobiales bacterium]
MVDRSLRSATKKSINRGASFIRAATTLLERSNGDGFTVQEVADEAGQSLRTLYQYFESKDDLLLAVFEEAMKTYALMIRESIADIDDPLERLAGAVMAASRMPERSTASVDAGLARLRLKLGEVEPELVARSQEPVLTVFTELYRQAVAAGSIVDRGEQQAVYMITALNGAFITSRTLGNDSGLELPDHPDLARFCMQGLGAEVDDAWYEKVSDLVRLPQGLISSWSAGAAGADATEAEAGADVARSV